LWKIPWILRVEDLYPQAAVNAGVLRNRTAIRFFEALEMFLYRRATHISLISPAFKQNLTTRGIPETKLSVSPVWADPKQILPLEKENAFRKEHGLAGKFVLLYAGNLGHTSALEDVLSAAEILGTELVFQFVIVGEGVKKTELQERAAQLHLDNVTFLPYQPRQRYPELLAASDVGLVTLNENSSGSSLPSKTFNIMASVRPVLSVAAPHSDLAKLIEKYSCGINIIPGNTQALVGALKDLHLHPEKAERFGWNGRKALVEHYSRSQVLLAYEKLFLDVVFRGNLSVDPGKL